MENGLLKYRTAFYKFKEGAFRTHAKEPFAFGPWGMKDIRICQLPDGKIAVFTRPQGKIGGLGKVAYTEIDRLEDLEQGILDAKIIPQLFIDGREWGGANQAFALDENRIGVLGHIACETVSATGRKLKHYYAITFIFDRRNLSVSNLKIIATANDFPEAKCKREELKDVVFSGSIDRLENGRAILYVGIGDRQAGYIEIPDPFRL
jgi:hypothetical protein